MAGGSGVQLRGQQVAEGEVDKALMSTSTGKVSSQPTGCSNAVLFMSLIYDYVGGVCSQNSLNERFKLHCASLFNRAQSH